MIELNEENDKIIEIIDKNHKEKVLSFFILQLVGVDHVKK